MKRLFLVVSILAGLVQGRLLGVEIIGDNYNVTGSGSGFALGSGANSGINPPTTRLTGIAASGLRYINTGTKATAAYTITGNKIRITSAANPGRFVFSADGTTPFDFGPTLGVSLATPAKPIVYDLTISIDNDSAGIQRCSFAIGTAEGDAFNWDFGVQVYRAASGNNFYTIGKRIDTGSSGLGADLNSGILTMGASTYGTEISILMRVTDAGAETTTYNSRVQLSLNGGSTWFYDTATDSDLTGTGWRLDGAGRYVMWDIAPDAGNVTYENFALNWLSGPRTWNGAGANGNWNTAANWGGIVPTSGSPLMFNGTTRQTNTNDLTGLVIPSLTLNNGGFTLYGNTFTNSGSITNVAGNNTLKAGLAWSSTAAKRWSVANGSELLLDNVNAVEVNGDQTLSGGGTLRLTGTLNIGQATAANPAFTVSQGSQVIDGGTFNTRGDYRVGPAQASLINSATLALTSSGAKLRVGDSASSTTSQLSLNNSTITLGGATLALPYTAGATGTVSQVGGTISGGTISFSDVGAGAGTYTIQNGTLEAVQIKKTTGTGSATISFDNATLRTASGANATFLTGLNTAQILSGGLTVDATSDVTIGQALSGAGALTKIGSSKITLTGANTYTGDTLISAGTLAIGAGGSITTPNITLTTGTTFDVSGAGSFALGASQTVIRNATSGTATLTGPVTFNAGAKVSLQMDGTASTVGTLSVGGNLTLNGNTISVNVTGTSLALGTYTLLTYSGTKTGSFSSTPTITGSGLAMGLGARIVESAGVISLKVYLPAHGVAAANIQVIENDLANTAKSVVVTATTSINGLFVRDGSSRGDYVVQVGSSGTDDLANGVMMTTVAENGRDHGEDSGINYCTAALSSTASGYFIPTSSAPDGKEYNINVAAAYFPYNKWLGGYARNSAGTVGGANNLLTGSSGLVLGTHFVDNGGGVSTVNLTSLGINSQTDGVLLATAGANDDNYAASFANVDGTWTIRIKDNGTNAAAWEQDPVAFVFIPKNNVSVISGKFQGDGSILMYNDTTPRFSVTNFSEGNWRLTIPGYSPSSGVLIMTPEGGSGASQDNTLSYQPSGNTWIIQSRDIPSMGLQTPASPVASFVFIPGPQATLVSPANNANVSSAPTLKVNASNNVPGNVTVTFYGHEAPKPGPGEDFMITVLPDTQNYSDYTHDGLHGRFYEQTEWIIANRDTANIAYVAQLGDIVQNGDNVAGGPNGEEWQVATNAMYRLESQSRTLRLDGIPYGCSVGNHDQEPNGDEDGTTTHFNQYFGTSHFADKAYYGGHYSANNDSFFNLFSAGGMDFIVFSYEFGRYGSGVLDWTDDVLATNQNRRIIVMTHHAGSDYTPSSMSAQGQAIFDRLKTRQNFFLMLGGHVFNGTGWGEGSRSDTVSGHTIRTLVSDYQNRPSGGDSLMRLMYFSPSNNTVSIKTYSPHTDTYETDADSQFSFSYNMQPNGAGTAGTAYTAIKTNVNVVPGAQSSFVWTGLAASKPYEWYVTVTTEEGDYATSVEWKFNTTSGFARPAGDADGNGLADTWETKYGVTEPDADADGDGQNNLSEYLAHTNPTNAASLFRITGGERESDGHFTITWSSVGGTRYRVQYTDDFRQPFTDIERDAESETDHGATGNDSKQSFTDPSAPANGSRCYRVVVIP